MASPTYYEEAISADAPAGSPKQLMMAYLLSQNGAGRKEQWNLLKRFGLVSGDYNPKSSNTKIDSVFKQLNANPSTAQNVLQGIQLSTPEQVQAFQQVTATPGTGDGSPTGAALTALSQQQDAAKAAATPPPVATPTGTPAGSSSNDAATQALLAKGDALGAAASAKTGVAYTPIASGVSATPAAGGASTGAAPAAGTGTPTSTTGAGVTYDPSWATYGITPQTWSSMNAMQQGTVAAALSAAKGLYAANASSVTLASALAAAATDPTITAKYSDALGLDSAAFQQSLQQLQQATTTESQQYTTQFENERKQLADASAAAGQAYSGFRGEAQKELGQTETGIVNSSLSALQQNLKSLTQGFEAKYGTAATTAATAGFVNPFTAGPTGISGLSVTPESSPTTLTGNKVGGITGSQPVAEQQDINARAGQYIQAGQLTPVTPAV